MEGGQEARMLRGREDRKGGMEMRESISHIRPIHSVSPSSPMWVI